MRVLAIPTLCLVACLISSIKGEIFNGRDENMENSIDKNVLDKTVELINKRAYYYATSGPGKRLPNYDFGLGKRAGAEPEINNNVFHAINKRSHGPNIHHFMNDLQSYDKRARPYSFGLGKRNEEASLEEYDSYDAVPFGAYMEQARQDNLKRARPYSFGLGKREGGKEERRSSNSRYNFGLGKR